MQNIKTKITQMHYQRDSKGVLFDILKFCSYFYGFGSRMKNFLYDNKILKPKRVNAYVISVGNMTFNRRKYQLQTAVGSVELTKNEAVILQNLIDHMGAVVHREVLHAQIDTYGFCNSNRTVDVHVSALRKKLNRIDSNLEILTKRGVGYILRIELT